MGGKNKGFPVHSVPLAQNFMCLQERQLIARVADAKMHHDIRHLLSMLKAQGDSKNTGTR